MKLLHSHPVGSQFVRQASKAFQDAGILSEFWTTIARRRESRWDRFVPTMITNELKRRAYDDDILERTKCVSSREILRLAASKAGLKGSTRHEYGRFSFDKVARHFDLQVAKRIEKGGVDAVYAYEDCALATFQSAAKSGIVRIYEHPVGYWREVQRVFEEESESHPEYAAVISGIGDSQLKRERKDFEIGNASLLVVPSHYSARTLEQCPTLNVPVEVVNYGAPESLATGITACDATKLRVLFVGSVQQRKGISYLVQACRDVSSAIEVFVVGARVAACKPVDHWLNQAQWTPSAPHWRVLEIMRECDVLVLPSLSEGFGLVVLEAMSQGLTVIVSDNTGASDVLENGVSGFVVPIRSSDAIAAKLEMLHQDRDLLGSMKAAALKTAALRTWSEYRSRLVEAVLGRVGARL